MAGPRLHPRIRHVPALLGFTIVILVAPVSLESAQQTPVNPVAQAQALRASGNFTAAAELLRNQLAEEPDNGDAARLLAQTLYWLKDVDEARKVYDLALARHPNDTAVRLDYARMLLETGRRREAAQLLMPLQARAETQVEANALLGTLAYWEGDLTAAQRRFQSVLQSSPKHPESLRQLREIQTLTAPWVRVSSGIGSDDQPLDRLAFGVEGGWFATPLLPVTFRVQPASYRVNDASTRRVTVGEVELSHFAPAAQLETQATAGIVQRRGGNEGSDWTGRASLGIRLPQHVVLRAKADRLPYFSTTSSFDSEVAVQSRTVLVRWEDPRGWLGEAAFQHQEFPDDNSTRSAYAWQLAPVVHRPLTEIHVGYAFSAENAEESRFVLAAPAQAFAVTDPGFSTAGRYSPYYTPIHLVSHSLIASLTLTPTTRTTFRLRGGRAIHAKEDAPVFVVTQGQVQPAFARRTFSPWHTYASVDLPLGRRTTLAVTGEHSRTAFYTWWATGVGITTRFQATP